MRGALLLLVWLLFAGGPAAEAAGAAVASGSPAIDAAALIRKIETQYQGRSSHGTISMTIRTSQWSRTLVMEAWSEGRDRFLTRILDPRKERGTCTLKVGNDIWNYFPRIDRLVKIPSSLMGDRWMGSHLTNDDLVKENKVDELYELAVERREGTNVTIVGVPRPAAAVVWGKIRYEADLEREVPVRVTYFDEENRLVRTMTFTDLQRIDGRWLPMRFTIRPEEEPDEETVLAYENLTFDLPLEQGLFSIQRLRRAP
ncbi:MAG TPA: outer membrane lipoprotein-sorting protein [Candidatus Ozemobacteraceae bacterium]|nr:outer membrane lipoprotein-sorting protein [Candidatus Ozemobacteraceae bacterium]